MLKPLIVCAALCGLGACTNHYEPLPMVKDDAPVFQLNSDRWTATVNDLTAPPDDGAPRTLPQPVPANSQKVRLYE